MDVQALVKSIRTDLDQFSWQEIFALVRHGYEVALHGLAAQRRDLLEAIDWEADDPAPVGWPRAPIEQLQGFRLARRVVGVVTQMTDAWDKSSREIQQAAIKAGARLPSR